MKINIDTMNLKIVVKRRHKYRPSNNMEYDIHYRTAVHKYSKSKRGKRNIVVLRFGEEIMNQLGWKTGEGVEILQDQDDLRNIVLRRDINGYNLAPALAYKQTYTDLLGKSVRATITGTIDPDTTLLRTYGDTIDIREYQIEDGVLFITLPRTNDDLKQ